jgi:hypothetical protein
VSIVTILVYTARIMKHRKQRYYIDVGTIELGHSKAILEYTRPMDNAVMTPQRKSVAIKDDAHDCPRVFPHGLSRL